MENFLYGFGCAWLVFGLILVIAGRFGTNIWIDDSLESYILLWPYYIIIGIPLKIRYWIVTRRRRKKREARGYEEDEED